MGVASGCGEQEVGVASGSGQNLWVCRGRSRIFLIGGLSVAHRKPRPLITNNHALIIRSKFINTIAL